MFVEVLRENCFAVAPGLWWIVLPQRYNPTVNCYVLESQGHWVLIDAGDDLPLSLRALGRALKSLGIPRRGLQRILVTHRHWDHVGGAAGVQEHWGGDVYLPEEETEPISFAAETMLPWLARHGVPAERRADSAGRRAVQRRWPARVQSLRPGAVIPVGDLRLEVLAAAGHSGGHVVFAEPQRGWLLTGDAVIEDVGWNIWYHACETGDIMGEYLQTLERIANLSCNLVLPGHGRPFAGSQLAAVARETAVLHRQRSQELLAVMGADELSAYAVALRAGAAAADGNLEAVSEALTTTLPVLYFLEAAGMLRRREAAGEVRWSSRVWAEGVLEGSGGR